MAIYSRYTGQDTQEALLLEASRQNTNSQRVAGSHLITMDFGDTTNVVTPVPGQLMYDTPTATPMMWDGLEWIPLGGGLVANTTVVWVPSFGNPFQALDHPVTLLFYAIDDIGFTAVPSVPAHICLYDQASAPDVSTLPTLVLPSPEDLGANSSLALKISTGLWISAIDQDGAFISSNSVYVSVAVFDPTI